LAKSVCASKEQSSTINSLLIAEDFFRNQIPVRQSMSANTFLKSLM